MPVIAYCTVPHSYCTAVVQVLPEAPRELVEELSRRYVYLYERITGKQFQPPYLDEPVQQRMTYDLASYL
jgi:phosphoribosylaminoimidazole-succinocarboxamide synthase